MRLRYGPAATGGGRFRREPPWAHDFPRADFTFMKILSELTLRAGRSSTRATS